MSFKIRLALIIKMLIAWSFPVQAQMLEINPETKTKGQISKGDLTALIDVQKTEDWKPTITVLLKGKAVGKLEGAESPFPAALVQITELDPSNLYPEVLLSSFTGGAHCCNEISILTSDKSGKRWQKVNLGPFDGSTQGAEDIDKDGRDEFVTVDNRFLYQFSSYAGSAAPAQIWQLNGNQFINVSYEPKFKFFHRQNLKEMSSWFTEKRDSDSEVNGFLAAYVANKALVGEFADGWKRMLKYYDKKSDWGLTDCPQGYNDQGKCIGKEIHYQSFPQALRAFLVETGYIPSQGKN